MPAISDAQRHKVNRDPITDEYLLLLEFQEDGRDTVHRAVINNENITISGNVYYATDMALSLPSSSEEGVGIRLEMSNLTRDVGAALLRARNQIGCRIKWIDYSSPTVNLIDTRNMLVIRQVSVDSTRISAQVEMRSSLQIPFPFPSASRSRYPGLYFPR